MSKIIQQTKLISKEPGSGFPIKTAKESIYVHYNVNPEVQSQNWVDADGNPEGGYVIGVGMDIHYQRGPRATENGEELAPANGAFVEDVIYAALQRLQFFQDSKYSCRENAIAITKLEEALDALKRRQLARTLRDVEGKYEV